MKAYNNDESLKNQLVALALGHEEKDRYIKGTFGEFESDEFRGCSVGCTIFDVCKIEGIENPPVSSHKFLADKLGVPLFITRLQDTFFENISDGRRKTWTSDFLSAIRVGADLTPVLPKTLLSIINIVGEILKPDVHKNQIIAIDKTRKVINDWIDSGEPDLAAARAAAEAVWAAEEVWAAEAVWAAEEAEEAVWAVASEAVWAVAALAAEAAAFDKCADKFIQLIKGV